MNPYFLLATLPLPEFNEEAMAQLTSMGFPEIRCKRALLETGNNNAAVAMEWLFLHMEDPGDYTRELLLNRI